MCSTKTDPESGLTAFDQLITYRVKTVNVEQDVKLPLNLLSSRESETLYFCILYIYYAMTISPLFEHPRSTVGSFWISADAGFLNVCPLIPSCPLQHCNESKQAWATFQSDARRIPIPPVIRVATGSQRPAHALR